MKKRLSFFLVFALVTTSFSFADAFTDAIQDLAIQTACKGAYSMTEAGGVWNDDPHDYYQPWMMAERFAKLSGAKTRTETFYGICFDYAQFAFKDIERFEVWYQRQGLYERQYWIAETFNNANEIELTIPTTRGKETRMQNGVPIRSFGKRNAKSHEGATLHAWLWIERADGVWFWIDPTWTDNLGYVVYGYVQNGEEIQCRPDKKYCVEYPDYLNSLPLPPKMGSRISPSRTVNSKNREETINDAAPNLVEAVLNAIVNVDYSSMHSYLGLLASCNIPFDSMRDNAVSPSKMSFGLEMPVLSNNIALLFGLDYLHNLTDSNHLHAGLFTFDFDRRFFNNMSWFIGGGLGLRFDTSNKDEQYVAKDSAPIPQTGLFAFKANTGFLFNLSYFLAKVEVAYDNVIGFSVGAGVGIEFEMY